MSAQPLPVASQSESQIFQPKLATAQVSSSTVGFAPVHVNPYASQSNSVSASYAPYSSNPYGSNSMMSVSQQDPTTRREGLSQAPVEEESVWFCPRNNDDLHYTYRSLCETVFGRVIRFFLLIIPVAMIVSSSLNSDKCPIRPILPIWCIVSGTLWVVYTLIYFLFGKSEEKNTLACRFIEAVYIYACFVWLICGTVWVFGLFTTVELTDPNSPQFCEPTVFVLASGLLLSIYFFIAVIMFFLLFTFTYSYYQE